MSLWATLCVEPPSALNHHPTLLGRFSIGTASQHKAHYVMEWTQPHFETASMKRAKMVTSTIKKEVRGSSDESYNARHRLGKEHLSSPRRRRARYSGAAKTSHS